jgi:hypothetical protein
MALIHRDYRPELLKIVNEETKNRGGWLIRQNAMPNEEKGCGIRVPDANAWTSEKERRLTFSAGAERTQKERIRNLTIRNFNDNDNHVHRSER